jgi:3-hydroxyisobutyrate dehydrogenase-like beta-hydroxyacid dehydrogenase
VSTVAFLGLGRMGAPMAANLAAAGHDVTVWNRTTATAERFAEEHGTVVAASPARAADGADFVVSMLADDDIVKSAHLGPDGSLSRLVAGTVVVDMSTVTIGTARELGDAVAAAGGSFLNAPVSGSVKAATDAALTVMVGGDEQAFATARPVLEAMGTPVHLGGVGVGAAMKLAVNTVVHGLNGALSEALVLAEKAGIERTTAYEVFARSAVAAPFVHYRREAFEHPGEVPVAFRLELAVKDLRYALELAADSGAGLPQTERSLAVLQDAVEAGYGDHDESAVAQYLRDR